MKLLKHERAGQIVKCHVCLDPRPVSPTTLDWPEVGKGLLPFYFTNCFRRQARLMLVVSMF